MRHASQELREREAAFIYRRLHPYDTKPLDRYTLSNTINNILSSENTYHPRRRNRSARSEPWF